MSLETDKVLKVLHGTLTERVDSLQQALGKGTAKDYAEYQYMAGQIRGLLEACHSINGIYIETIEADE